MRHQNMRNKYKRLRAEGRCPVCQKQLPKDYKYAHCEKCRNHKQELAEPKQKCWKKVTQKIIDDTYNLKEVKMSINIFKADIQLDNNKTCKNCEHKGICVPNHNDICEQRWSKKYYERSK